MSVDLKTKPDLLLAKVLGSQKGVNVVRMTNSNKRVSEGQMLPDKVKKSVEKEALDVTMAEKGNKLDVIVKRKRKSNAINAKYETKAMKKERKKKLKNKAKLLKEKKNAMVDDEEENDVISVNK